MPKFIKKIMTPGTYEVAGKTVYISPERLQKWAANHQALVNSGLRIPAPWRHDPTALPFRQQADSSDIDASKNAGWWTRVWVEKDALYGEVEIPRGEDASRVGTTVTEVSPLITANFSDGGKKYDEAMTHIALVTHPVVKNQENFQPAEIAASIAFSSEDFLAKSQLEDSSTDLPFASENLTPDTQKVMATGASISKVIPILAKIGIRLPDDTTEANFAERIIVAALALSCADEESDSDGSESPPSDSEEKPSPIAMSQETKLSEAQQGQLAFAKTIITNQYAERVKSCLEKGKITPKQVEDIKPLFESVTLEFSAEGQVKPNALDQILHAWESIPEGSILTNRTSAQLVKEKEAQPALAFSLGSVNFDFKEQPRPNDSREMTEEDIDKIVDQQLKVSGY